MNSVPLFPVGNVRDFVALQRATPPDPATGKPDPAALDAFMAAHPEPRAFGAPLRTRPIPSTFANAAHNSLTASPVIASHGPPPAARSSLPPAAAVAQLHRSRVAP